MSLSSFDTKSLLVPVPRTNSDDELSNNGGTPPPPTNYLKRYGGGNNGDDGYSHYHAILRKMFTHYFRVLAFVLLVMSAVGVIELVHVATTTSLPHSHQQEYYVTGCYVLTSTTYCQ